MVSKIMNHLDQHQSISGTDFVKVTCETQLIVFVDDLAKEMQNGGQTDAIYSNGLLKWVW